MSSHRLLVLGGAPKVGKSDLLIALLVHMAVGVPFLGFTPPRPLRIFYLQAEIQYHYLRERLQGIWLDPALLSAARDNLVATPVLAQDIKENYARGDDLMIVSPDVGGVVRARALASRLDADLAIVDKRRPKAGESEVMNIIGDVQGRRCILFDDIVDSGGTLVNAAKALIDQGATEVSAYISHGVLSGPAVQRITDGPLKELVITNSIEQPHEVLNCRKIRTVSVAPLPSCSGGFAHGPSRWAGSR